MTARMRLKEVAAYLALSVGLTKRSLRARSPTRFTILMYHRILPGENVTPAIQAGMYVEPETFDMHLRTLRKWFDIVPLARLHVEMAAGRPEAAGKPLCALTFDDGWEDFARYAYPILQHYSAPVTVFLPTDFIGSNRWFWTDRLARALLESDRCTIGRSSAGSDGHDMPKDLLKHGGDFASRLELAIERLKDRRIEEIEEVIAGLASDSSERTECGERAFLTWDEVSSIHSEGLVDFGSHTAGHFILPTLTQDEVRDELVRSRNILLERGLVNPAFVSFCYPNGSFSSDIVEQVRNLGYQMAVTTERGWNAYCDDPLTLRRVGVHQHVAASEAMFAARVAGYL